MTMIQVDPGRPFDASAFAEELGEALGRDMSVEPAPFISYDPATGVVDAPEAPSLDLLAAVLDAHLPGQRDPRRRWPVWRQELHDDLRVRRRSLSGVRGEERRGALIERLLLELLDREERDSSQS